MVVWLCALSFPVTHCLLQLQQLMAKVKRKGHGTGEVDEEAAVLTNDDGVS